HREMRQAAPGSTRPERAPIRYRAGQKNLRKCLAAGVEPMDRVLQNAAERISPEPGTPRRSTSDREADGAIFLWRRRGSAPGLRCSRTEAVISSGSRAEL